MTTTITHRAGTITPTIVDGFESSSEARNVVHYVLGRSDPDITMHPASLRAGQLTLVFESAADAASAEAILRAPQVFHLSDADVSQVTMSFVLGEGELTLRLDDETRSVWLLEVPFQEVLP